VTRAITLLTAGAGVTSTGPVRDVNQDRFLCDDRLGLYAVFDGVGGHKAGEIAAQLAMETMAGYISRSADDGDDSTWPLGWDPRMTTTSNRLRTAVLLANQRVYLAAQANAELEGMATTVAAVLVAGSVISLAHVGDSRIYRVVPGPPRQLTDDDAATIDRHDESGELVGTRRALTRALGVERDVLPSVAEMPAHQPLRLLISSDGLHGVVEVESAAAAQFEGDRAAVSARLVDQAIEAGTRDNVTVVIVDIGERQ
jgi:serine/threonine protein phosphatase PrpC